MADLARDQIEYTDEEPWVRGKFREELGKKGAKSLMPPEAYRDPNYKWDFKMAYAKPM